MELIVMGSGTSHGIPVVGCSCSVCKSYDKHDKRFRASLYVKGTGGERFVVDTGPEFRLQALRAHIHRIDLLLLTHSHADHLHGLDDVRPLTYSSPLPVFGTRQTLDEIEERFSYIWKKTQKGGGKPRIVLNEAGGSFSSGGITITPIDALHGQLKILGWKFTENGTETAYITDCSFLPAASLEMLNNISVLIIGALRMERHETHYSFDDAFRLIQQIKSPKLKQVYFTHIAHNHSHRFIKGYCRKQCINMNIRDMIVEPAFDMMRISL